MEKEKMIEFFSKKECSNPLTDDELVKTLEERNAILLEEYEIFGAPRNHRLLPAAEISIHSVKLQWKDKKLRVIALPESCIGQTLSLVCYKNRCMIYAERINPALIDKDYEEYVFEDVHIGSSVACEMLPVYLAEHVPQDAEIVFCDSLLSQFKFHFKPDTSGLEMYLVKDDKVVVLCDSKRYSELYIRRSDYFEHAFDIYYDLKELDVQEIDFVISITSDVTVIHAPLLWSALRQEAYMTTNNQQEGAYALRLNYAEMSKEHGKVLVNQDKLIGEVSALDFHKTLLAHFN